LIEHSAGSGKSNTIGWLAHRLSSLHDEQDRRVFDSVIVITDRRVLDQQTTVKRSGTPSNNFTKAQNSEKRPNQNNSTYSKGVRTTFSGAH